MMLRGHAKNLKRRSGLCAAWGLSLFLAVCVNGEAQQAGDAGPGVQAELPATLTNALRPLADAGETGLAVGADKDYALDKSVRPPAGARIAQIAPFFGHITRRYGSVTAIAPATMSLLNGNLGTPNIYLNIPPHEAFTLLAANMSEAQLQMLTSERGIGLADMNSDLQRGLFLALIPSSALPYSPRVTHDNHSSGGAGGTLENPLQNGRLRIGMKQQMAVHSIGRESNIWIPDIRDPNGPPIYDAANQDHLTHQDAVDGVTVHSEAPNTLKKSQLNYGLPILQTSISLQGVKTVGELMARISAKTRLELVVDRHYESKLLTVVGANHVAPVSDLLRALAVCVTGTYRRVGPAYVLTDDLAGVGTRRIQIAEFQADADAQRRKFLADAEEKLQQTQALWKRPLSSFGDPLAPTPTQMTSKEIRQLGGGAYKVLEMNFDRLTPAQQDALKRYSEFAVQSSPNGSYKGIDFERSMEMNLIPSVQLLAPGVDGPIDTDLGQSIADNFHEMTGWNQRQSRKLPPNPKDANAPEAPLPSLSALVSAIPRRALLADCRTTADVENTVAKMKRMGLNELWLVAFTKGVARVGGTPFPMSAPDAPDLLAYALKITRGTGIALYPVMDVFQWGSTMPQNEVDLTITGETSVQYAQRIHKRNMLKAAANGGDMPAEPSLLLTASIFAPEVIARLNLLAASLARRPGVAGIVWRETDPVGYAEPDSRNNMRPAGNEQMGYTEPARLAFLRSHHADPVDIEPLKYGEDPEQRANTDLPIFDDWQLSVTLGLEWNVFRKQANIQALNRLYEAVKPQNGGPQTSDSNSQAQNGSEQAQTVRQEAGAQKSGETKPMVFVRERHASYGTTWYGLWTGPDTPLPTHHYDYEGEEENGNPKRAPEEFEQARKQSKINLLRLPFAGSLDETALVKQWQKRFKDMAQNPKWEGFVLEMTGL